MKVLGEFHVNVYTFSISVSVQLSCCGLDLVVSGFQCVVGRMCINSVDSG